MKVRRRAKDESLRDWFLEHVNVPAVTEACWEWLGPKDRYGYGRCSFNGGRWRSHQVSFRIFKGPIPNGHQINHHCDNRICVRPTHIYSGTQLENIGDMLQRERNVAHKGEKHSQASISEAQAKAIMRLIEADRLSHAEIAKFIGCSRNVVANISCGRRWTHLSC